MARASGEDEIFTSADRCDRVEAAPEETVPVLVTGLIVLFASEAAIIDTQQSRAAASITERIIYSIGPSASEQQEATSNHCVRHNTHTGRRRCVQLTTRSRWQICVYTDGQGKAAHFHFVPPSHFAPLRGPAPSSTPPVRGRSASARAGHACACTGAHSTHVSGQWLALARAFALSTTTATITASPPTLTPLLPSAGNLVSVSVYMYTVAVEHSQGRHWSPGRIRLLRLQFEPSPYGCTSAQIHRPYHDALLNLGFVLGLV
ncbi:hypothetical protein SORBI_3003G340200 [Sorghum bicolor]|uniref:Uncharacterized protein n=1 Tax=Sorghum bicolor TaxID=4558 RepID=A0A1B6Q6U8_SORBI|nr:hypothetical protein SORBI_3003G340200 [Sorghum bicolor]